MKFVGRQTEMARLEDELAAVRRGGAGRFVWIYGRRRVGKSRLVQEFCDDSGADYCFFQGQRRERPEALAEFIEAVAESSLASAAHLKDVSFSTWHAALRGASQDVTEGRPAIIVIDELPHLVEADAGFASDLQKAWDRVLRDRPVLLVAVGSDTRMMEALVGARAPLFGRPTLELRVDPLVPPAIATLTGAHSPSEAIDHYLVIGGMPELAAAWKSTRAGTGTKASAGTDIWAFLAAALANDSTPFVTSALRVLSAEFEAELPTRRVLEAIGHGETVHGRIASRSQVSARTLSLALDALTEQKRLVTRSIPYAVPPSPKNSHYTVTDPYLRFWLRFVAPNLDEIARGRGDLTVARIRRDWPTYRGRAVEPIVRLALERLLLDPALSTQLGEARHVGGWWRRDGSVEIDLVGGDRPDPSRIGFLGSVKWREDGPFTAEDAKHLAEARAVVPGAASAKLIAVTRKPQRKNPGVDRMFSARDLIGAWPE